VYTETVVQLPGLIPPAIYNECIGMMADVVAERARHADVER